MNMLRKTLSWVLVGAFAYLWWWAGHRWPFINVKGNEWTTIYMLFTLISAVVMLRSARAGGTGLFGGLIATVTGFLPNLLWLALAIVVARLLAWVHIPIPDPVDHFLHAIVAVVVAGFTTSLWYGAIVNADPDS